MDTLLLWVQDNPSFAAGVVIVLIVAIAARKRGTGKYAGKTDPQRLFTVAQKTEAGRRCGNSRCEHKNPLWFRCNARGTHGDHIYPHSRGGATTLSNLQLLCPTHNLRKSASIPSVAYIWRLEQRRAKYYPDGVPGRVEWRIGRAA